MQLFHSLRHMAVRPTWENRPGAANIERAGTLTRGKQPQLIYSVPRQGPPPQQEPASRIGFCSAPFRCCRGHLAWNVDNRGFHSIIIVWGTIKSCNEISLGNEIKWVSWSSCGNDVELIQADMRGGKKKPALYPQKRDSIGQDEKGRDRTIL